MINIIVFVDWDNTLLPTQALMNDEHFFKYGTMSEVMKKQLGQLEEVIINLLDEIKSKSNLFVITNATINWVIMSTKTYFPKLNEKLGQYNVISAQDLHKDKYPKNIIKWKYESFKQIIDDIQTKLSQENNVHLISIADGEIEGLAIDMLRENEKLFIKKIIILPNSPINRLRRQLLVIRENLNHILTYEGNMNIKMKLL